MVVERGPSVPRFSVRQLLLAVALLAAGFGLMLAGVRSGASAEWEFNPKYGAPLWLSGGALVGAGIMKPWGRPYAGAAVGFQIQIVTMIVVLSILNSG
jgi:hypothetical protein